MSLVKFEMKDIPDLGFIKKGGIDYRIIRAYKYEMDLLNQANIPWVWDGVKNSFSTL